MQLFCLSNNFGLQFKQDQLIVWRTKFKLPLALIRLRSLCKEAFFIAGILLSYGNQNFHKNPISFKEPSPTESDPSQLGSPSISTEANVPVTDFMRPYLARHRQ